MKKIDLTNKTMDEKNVGEFIRQVLLKYEEKNLGYDRIFWETALPLFAATVRADLIAKLTDKRIIQRVAVLAEYDFCNSCKCHRSQFMRIPKNERLRKQKHVELTIKAAIEEARR